MRKCCTCGKRFNLLAKNRYEVVVKPAGLECLTKGTTYFNAFDCPCCGCQNIVGIVEKEREDVIEVLDKIRAEIMDFEEELFHRPNTDYADYAAVRHCVEIIDKYKAERVRDKE